MPKVITTLGETHEALADAIGEPLLALKEIHRHTNQVAEATRREITKLSRERGTPWVHEQIRAFRQFAGGPCSPTAIAHDVLALLTDGPRWLAALRGWHVMFASAADDGLCVLDRCPITHEPCFGLAFIRVLSDAELFSAATNLVVCGNRGLGLIEFGGASVATFRVSLPPEPPFEPAQAIGRWRSIKVEQLQVLRPLFSRAKDAARA
jgi:hypothetical protein